MKRLTKWTNWMVFAWDTCTTGSNGKNNKLADIFVGRCIYPVLNDIVFFFADTNVLQNLQNPMYHLFQNSVFN